ncbi:hypothetical protein OH764_20775 [Burkholderia sp. M6-3]
MISKHCGTVGLVDLPGVLADYRDVAHRENEPAGFHVLTCVPHDITKNDAARAQC